MKDLKYFNEKLSELETELSEEFFRLGEINFVEDEDNLTDEHVEHLDYLEIRTESGKVKNFRVTSISKGLIWGIAEDFVEDDYTIVGYRFADLAEPLDRINLISMMQDATVEV